MIGAIPNPTKRFQVERPAAEVKAAIKDIYLFSNEYTIVKEDPVINQFTFGATEFLSAGVYIDVLYFVVNETRTDVSIEVRRKVGSFNQSHEVSLGNTHLSRMTELISQSLSTPQSQRATMTAATTAPGQPSSKTTMILWIVAIALIAFVLIMMKASR